MLESILYSGNMQVYTVEDLDRIPHLRDLPRSDRLGIRAVASVLPFRVNSYVLENLIDWDRAPDDPIYRLVVPRPGMLLPADFGRMAALVEAGAPRAAIRTAAAGIRARLNPDPAGQRSMNVPRLGGAALPGMQHKYPETVLFFPAGALTCHTYCTYCFRWPQFVGDRRLRFASRRTEDLVAYLRIHPEVTDVLLTGGEPLVMPTDALRRIIEPLLGIGTVRNIRIGTKAISWWPFRFTTDPDAGELLRLFERVVASGRHLAVMAHVSHPRELEPSAARKAVRAIAATGAVLRSQAPLIRHVNDDPAIWRLMWRRQVRLGIVPYYMFVERDTGAQHYFSVPLARAVAIYREAVSGVTGLGRTARGPVMSATPGKVLVQGVVEVAGRKVFALSFLQARRREWVRRIFHARYDPEAVWLDDLAPAFGRREFFFDRDDPGRESPITQP